MKNVMKLFIVIVVSTLVSCGGGSSSNDNSQSPENPSKPLARPVTGLGIFALLNNNFPVQDAIDLLSVSERPAFAFANKTFGENTQNLITLVDSLKAKGKSPYIGVYAICGPCRVPRRDGSLVEFRRDLDIDSLNRGLANDPRTQQDYKNFLIDLRQNIVSLYNDLEFDVYTELESNMDDPAQRKAVEIAKEVFSSHSNVRIVVNPLSNNRFGSEPLEIHTDWPGNLPLVGRGDIISFDGHDFKFPGESGPGLSFEGTKDLIRQSKEKGVIVYLWRYEWQGLSRDSSFTAPTPDNRNYIFTNKSDIKELLRL